MNEKNPEVGIDPSDLQQDSPAEADAEVTDPDGDDEQGGTPIGINVAAIGQTGIITGGTGLGRV